MRRAAATALLVRSRTRPTEAAVLVLGNRGCLGVGLVAAVPLSTSVGVQLSPSVGVDPLGDRRAIRRRASSEETAASEVEAPLVTLEVADCELEEQTDRLARIEVFAMRLAALQATAIRHGYKFPSSHCNHDWLWSYGFDRLPFAFQSAHHTAWVRNHRAPSMVLGDIHLRHAVAERPSWRDVQPALRAREEEYCPQVQLQLLALTLNCGGQMPPQEEQSSLDKLFTCGKSAASSPDLVLVSLQETCPLVLAVDVTDTTVARYHAAWAREIGRALAAAGEYCCVADERMVGLQLLAFTRYELASSVRNVCSGSVRCGVLGAGNKGAVATSFVLHSTSFCFVDAHLASGTSPTSAEDRACDFRQVVASLRLEPRERDGPGLAVCDASGELPFIEQIMVEEGAASASTAWTPQQRTPRGLQQDTAPSNIFQHDVVVWAGDFNSRLYEDADMEVPLGRERTFHDLQQHKASLQTFLSEHDELSIQRARGGPPAAFKEAALNFAPTYKLVPAIFGAASRGKDVKAKAMSSDDDLQEDAYFKKRDPAFTDRAIWRARAGVRIEPVAYESIREVDFSDHRAVRLRLRAFARKIQWDVVQRICSDLHKLTPARNRAVSAETVHSYLSSVSGRKWTYALNIEDTSEVAYYNTDLPKSGLCAVERGCCHQ